MITFTVHEEPSPRTDAIDRAERLQFVREGFSLVTAYLGPLWLIANRLWLALAGYAAIAAIVAALTFGLGLPTQGLMLGLAAMHLLIGYEGDSLKRWSLARSGWSEVGTVSGRNRDECERRFFDTWLDDIPAVSRRLGPAATAYAASGSGERLAGRVGGWLRGTA